MFSIIIPTLDEEEGIAKTICSIPEKIKKDAEIIVVDVSTDMTPVIAEKLGAKVIKMKEKGKGRQMRRAVQESKGEILIFLDGDGTDPGQYIPLLLKKLETSHLVLGCRSMKEFEVDDIKMREIFQMYGFFIIQLFRLIGFKVKGDPLAGFRAIRRKDWDKLNLESNNFEIETEMNIKAMKLNFKIKEVLIPHLKRCGGGLKASKFAFNFKQYFEISKLFFKYLTNSKLKSKIKELEIKLKSKIKFP